MASSLLTAPVNQEHGLGIGHVYPKYAHLGPLNLTIPETGNLCISRESYRDSVITATAPEGPEDPRYSGHSEEGHQSPSGCHIDGERAQSPLQENIGDLDGTDDEDDETEEDRQRREQPCEDSPNGFFRPWELAQQNATSAGEFFHSPINFLTLSCLCSIKVYLRT